MPLCFHHGLKRKPGTGLAPNTEQALLCKLCASSVCRVSQASMPSQGRASVRRKELCKRPAPWKAWLGVPRTQVWLLTAKTKQKKKWGKQKTNVFKTAPLGMSSTQRSGVRTSSLRRLGRPHACPRSSVPPLQRRPLTGDLSVQGWPGLLSYRVPRATACVKTKQAHLEQGPGGPHNLVPWVRLRLDCFYFCSGSAV